VSRIDGLWGGPDLQGGARLAGSEGGQVSVTVEAVLGSVVARLDLEEAGVEAGIAGGIEGEFAGDVDGAEDLIGGEVVADSVPGADLRAAAGRREAAALPGRRSGPVAALRRTDQGERTGGGA
jgi:hypothetical protein